MFFRSKTKKAPTIETKPLKLTSPMLALEPRYVFDAALASDILHSADQLAGAPPRDTSAAQSVAGLFAAAGHGATLNEPLRDHAADAQVRALIDTLVDGRNAAASSQEIAFIDSRLSDIAGILSAIPEGTRIVMIDANRDGVEQMVEAMRGEAGVTGIHIISHGQAGSLQLGSSTLDANTMSTVYKQQLESLHNNLSETADILVYGCNFGAGDAGAEATALLASLTGADVASSDDLTGAAGQGGDWVLETRSGAVDAGAINAAGWNDTLAATNSGSWTVSGLTATNTTAGITTTITFTPNSANSAFGSVANQTFNTIPVFSNGADGDPSLSFVYTWDTTPEPIVTLPQPQASTDTGIGTVTITFSQPVTNPIINLDRLGGNSAYDPNTLVTGDEESISNGARWTLTSGGTLTKVSGTSHFDVTSSTIERTPNQAMSYTGTSTESGTNSLINTAAGSVRVNGTFTTITFQLTGVGVEGGGQDGIELGVIVDPPPNANNDTLSVAEDGTLTGNLFSNNGSGADADPQGDAITITQINGASFSVGTPIILANGTLTITNASTGAFTFVPNANYSGGQAFDYTISDPAGGTDTATATISITAVNDPPVAADDGVFTVTPGTSVTIAVLGNDTDIDGGALSVSQINGTTVAIGGSVTLPSGTIVTRNADGTLGVVMAPGNSDTETFIYTLSDGNGGTDTATVTLNRDSDGDGVANANDIDDDNDGILDTVESDQSLFVAEFEGTFGTLPQGSNYRDLQNPVPGYTYTTNITPAGTYVVTNGYGAAAMHPNTVWDHVRGHTTGNDDDAFLAVNGSTTQGTFFSETVALAANTDYDFGLWIRNAAAAGGPFGGAAGNPFNIEIEVKNSSGVVVASISSGDVAAADWTQVGSSFNTGSETQFTFSVRNLSTAFGGNDFSLDDIYLKPTQGFIARDTDGDGLNDHLDIDSDNDGITDNVEAQTTAGYIAPSGADTDSDGLDDAFDATPATGASGSVGVSPISTLANSDKADVPDYLDSDSDNDGMPDIAERSDGQPTTVTSTTDSDGDGLLDIFEGSNANDGFDVNDENLTSTTFNLADTDNDTAANGTGAIPLINDLDFRDANEPPVAVDDTLSTNEDTTLTTNILTANGIDSDPDGDPISITGATIDTDGDGDQDTLPLGTATPIVVGGNTIGTLTLTTTGALTFVPASNFHGAAPPMTYTLSDGNNQTDTAVVMITVNDVNDPPVATPSTSSGNEDTPIAVDLTGTDVDGTIASVTVTTLPPAAQGILYMPDGTTPVVAGTPIPAAQAANLVFAPALNFNGTVTIPFTVTDDDGAISVPANEVITVNDVNDPPVATPSTSSGDEDTNIPVDLTGTDVDGTIASVTVTTLPLAAQGILYMPDGTTPVVAGTPLTPAEAATLVFVPATNFNGTVTIPFTVTDDDGAISVPANEVITVNDVNDPPVATPSTSSGDEDTPIAVDLTGTDVDGTVTAITVTTLPPAAQGILYMPDGTTPVVAGMPIPAAQAANLVFAPALNFNGTVTIPFTVTDDDGAISVPANEVITVNDVNDPPVATPSTSSGDEDTPIAVDLTGTDVDGTVTAVTVTTLPPAAQGILYMPDGTTPVVAGTPIPAAQAANLVFAPALNFNGTVTIPFTVTDDDGAISAPANEVITVNDVNDPPIATPSTSSGDEDTNIPVDLTGTDVDGTIASVTVTTLPPAAQGILYMPDGTTPVVAGTPIPAAQAANLVFAPALNFNGTVTIPFTVTDEDGAVSAPANEVITVNDVNDPPVATPSTSSGDEDTPIAVDLTGTDVDGTVTAVTVTTLPPAAQGILYMPDGTTPVVAGTPLTPAEAATLVFVPATNFNGTVTIPFTVTDDDGAISVPADEVITVNDVNDPPVATPSTSSGDEDTNIPVDLTGTDVDGTVTAITVTTLPPAAQGILYMPDGTTPVVAGTPIPAAQAANLVFAPALNFNGTVTILFTVTDDDGAISAPANEVITVNDVNDPPVATPSTSSGDEDTPITVDLTGTDVDGTIASVTVTTLPPAAQGILYMPDGTTPVVAGTPIPAAQAANLVFAPALNFNGTVTIPFTVTDDDGAISAPANEVITVNDVNDPPIATPSTSSGDEDTNIPVDLTGTDVDGTIASVTVTTLPPAAQGILYMPDGTTPVVAGMPLTPAEAATLVFVPATNFNGTVTIPFTVTDDDGAVSAPANEVITVSPVNDAPVANPETISTGFDTPVVVDLLGNDTDIDNDPLTVVSASVPADQGTLTNVGGVWTFKAAPGFTGTATITYTMRDPSGETASSTHSVIISNVPPVLTVPKPGGPFINPDDPLNLMVPAFDSRPLSLDLDTYFSDANGHTLTYTPNLSGLPSWVKYDPVTHTLSGKPPADNTGSITVPVLVQDGHGATIATKITFVITNPPPDAVDGKSTTEYATPIKLPLLANDKDPDGDPLTVTSAKVPASQGTLALAGGNWVFTPRTGFTGIATITYTIRDQDGATDTGLHSVTVKKPPLIAKDDVFTANFEKPLKASAAQGDVFAKGSVFKIEAPPSSGAVTMKADGSYVFVPKPGFSGKVTFTYRVTDPTGAYRVARETINVASQAHECLVTFGKKRR